MRDATGDDWAYYFICLLVSFDIQNLRMPFIIRPQSGAKGFLLFVQTTKINKPNDMHKQ